MKTLLVPVEPHPAIFAMLETALLTATLFGSRIEGVASAQDIPAVVTEVGADWTMEDFETEQRQAVTGRQLFLDFMANHGVPAAATLDAPSAGWGGTKPIRDALMGEYARVFDLVVVGRPGGAGVNPRRSLFETVLFESGRPLLLAPPAAPKGLGRNILVHWNASPETARTLGAALPFLKRADRVTILTVEGSGPGAPTGDDLAVKLAAHGVQAVPISKPGSSRSSGEVILDQVAATGADLIVKGAYTQSRLRQMIFGGATTHILAHAEVPVFMAH